MKATSPRWHELQESEHDGERRALAYVREMLPDRDPWQAWPTFTFAAQDGRARECDLLVAGPDGLHLIEIKSWHGHLSNDGPRWTRGGRTEKNPLPLVEQKSKELRSYLEHEAALVDTSLQVPFIQASVFLSEPGMRCSLDRYARAQVFARDDALNDLPGVGAKLLFARAGGRPNARFLELLPQLLHNIGIASGLPSRQVGAWTIDRQPYDEGPTWQDFHATRTDIAWSPHRRVRIYLEAKRSDPDVRRSIRGAAEREFQVAAGVHHPGILAPSDFEEHELGPALVIEQDRSAQRLDHWLAHHGDKVTRADRVSLLNQLASAVAYAHRRGLVHRALSPRAAIVESGRLRVGEWQVSTRDMATKRSRHRAAPTSMAAGHLDPAVEPYLAPDFVTEGVDGTIDVDIFGVGAIAYLLLAGEPPAATRAELNQRLVDHGCLDPRSGDDALDAIVRDATRPSLSERTASVDDIVRSLQVATRPQRPETPPASTPVKPSPPPARDPLDAQPGDVLAGGYRVEKALGTGSSARAFLVRRDGSQNVLKIGLTPDADRLLTAEAAALEDLRHDHIVVLRRASFPVGDRRAIELSNAGEHRLADVLATDGPLRGERLRVAGDQLISAVEYLADSGVLHRDVKPSNVGIRIDRDPFRLALFDFSLAATPRDDVQSGTPGYLDPHLGVGTRTTYDAAAEQYALAATLHELASGSLPRWGDDGTAAAFVSAVTLDESAFDPVVKGPLAAFLRRALAKAAADRFATPGEMRTAWNALFTAPTLTVHAPLVTGLDVHVGVVSQLRRLDADARSAIIHALEAASTPRPHLVAPVSARDDRMMLLPAGDELAGVVLLIEGTERGLLLHLDAPDAAAAWARDHAASVNERSGELELRDVVALDRLAETFAPAIDLYAHVTAEQFDELGVDARIADWARSVPGIEELERAQPIVPPQQYGVLLPLARGVPVADLLRSPVGPAKPKEPVDPENLAAAVARSSGQIAMLEDLEELRVLLDKPISHFTTFLHPTQRDLARKANWGSMYVTGGPGTGKTVVALHRVKYLAETKKPAPGSILLTTFTRGLAEALDRDLAQMLEPNDLSAVEVVNIDSWAHGIVHDRLGTRLRMVADKDVDERWRAAAATAGATQSPAFLGAEWEQVVLAQRITTEDAYISCERRGRGKPLPAAQRPPVWRAVEAFAAGLRSDGLWTHMMIADEAARLLAAEEPPYEHVVVDEIQDLHPAHWRLVRAAVKPKPEDLFLTGDPHQRIYGHRVSLRSVDINIGGRRSTKLSLSYRTSAEILAWSMRMLGHHHETGLDDVADDLASYRSAFSGAAPDVAGADTRDEEMADLVEALQQWHDDGIAWEDIAVVGRSQWVWRPASKALATAGIPVVELRRSAGEPAVRVGTMHGLKGLEFRAVAVVGVNEGVVPRKSVTPASEDEVVHRNELQDERNLLFVAATRPRERLRVSWHGVPSPFLPEAAP